MSGGQVCTCKGTKEEKMKNWVVVDRNCNYSTFNGGRKTYSNYSSVKCLKCFRYWRTDAKYVNSLPNQKN